MAPSKWARKYTPLFVDSPSLRSNSGSNFYTQLSRSSLLALKEQKAHLMTKMPLKFSSSILWIFIFFARGCSYTGRWYGSWSCIQCWSMACTNQQCNTTSSNRIQTHRRGSASQSQSSKEVGSKRALDWWYVRDSSSVQRDEIEGLVTQVDEEEKPVQKKPREKRPAKSESRSFFVNYLLFLESLWKDPGLRLRWKKRGIL